MKPSDRHNLQGAAFYVVAIAMLLIGLFAGWVGKYSEGSFFLVLSHMMGVHGNEQGAKAERIQQEDRIREALVTEARRTKP